MEYQKDNDLLVQFVFILSLCCACKFARNACLMHALTLCFRYLANENDRYAWKLAPLLNLCTLICMLKQYAQ